MWKKRSGTRFEILQASIPCNIGPRFERAIVWKNRGHPMKLADSCNKEICRFFFFGATYFFFQIKSKTGSTKYRAKILLISDYDNRPCLPIHREGFVVAYSRQDQFIRKYACD